MFLPYGTYHIIIFMYLENFINGRFICLYVYKVEMCFLVLNNSFFNLINEDLIFFIGM